MPTTQHSLWTRVFNGAEYAYGSDPGPVARRAVRYHRAFASPGGRALDLGCGEGQDLAFLAEQGYQATGVDFVAAGVEKARRLLAARGLAGEVIHADIAAYQPDALFDLVIAVNSLQFMGESGLTVLRRLPEMVAPGGVVGVSLFGREEAQEPVADGCLFVTLPEVMAVFAGWQMLEAANLWQWNVRANVPQAFVTLVARNVPAGGSPLPLSGLTPTRVSRS